MDIVRHIPDHDLTHRLILATDLDGTFLGGTPAHRDRLYRWLNATPDALLIFVTGRDPHFIADLCASGHVPTPTYVIGDVGTTIAEFRQGQVAPIAALESHIRIGWEGKAELVRTRLSGVPGLWLQPASFRHRLSYQYDERFDRSALSVLDGLEVDILISHGCFVDILPRGVSKGPSLQRLIAHLGLSAERVLVAGDTLNDLSMFETGLHGAVVGGAEAELLAATSRLPRAHRCRHHGAGGIIEAIHAHGLHPNPPEVPK
ncbi:MAG: HAD-IIB family hydrolase [Rhodobacteraceae bacterium]|nr:MAG: HAD-IIB family hydrolase [Paracoccaceae bacterium]